MASPWLSAKVLFYSSLTLAQVSYSFNFLLLLVQIFYISDIVLSNIAGIYGGTLSRYPSRSFATEEHKAYETRNKKGSKGDFPCLRSAW